jgi:hypothetical protein
MDNTRRSFQSPNAEIETGLVQMKLPAACGGELHFVNIPNIV